jgi:hypothetical protein
VGNSRISRGHAARGVDADGALLTNIQPSYTLYFFSL